MMVLSFLYIAIGFIGLVFCTWVIFYYFGWIKYDDEREKRRKAIISRHGRMMLVYALIANIAAFILLYFNLPVLISVWREGLVRIRGDMIWSFIQVFIAMIGIYYCSGAFVYYFGWKKYDDEREERRKRIVGEYGVIILISAIIIDIAALILLYFQLPILMSM